jgi:hypothetical protein
VRPSALGALGTRDSSVPAAAASPAASSDTRSPPARAAAAPAAGGNGKQLGFGAFASSSGFAAAAASPRSNGFAAAAAAAKQGDEAEGEKKERKDAKRDFEEALAKQHETEKQDTRKVTLTEETDREFLASLSLPYHGALTPPSNAQ